MAEEIKQPEEKPEEEPAAADAGAKPEPKAGPDWERAANDYRAQRDAARKQVEDLQRQANELKASMEGLRTPPLGAYISTRATTACAIVNDLPLAGSDIQMALSRAVTTYFNPRSPCGERLGWSPQPIPMPHFNPRSPCGERRCRSSRSDPRSNFNPRSPCGERPGRSRFCRFSHNFNPCSPCGERHAFANAGVMTS